MSNITFIARMTCKPTHIQEFVRHCQALQDHVAANEPDTLIYQFFRLRDPNRYAVLEQFRDEAAEHRHMSSKPLAELGPKISACLEGTWVREYFDPLA